MSKPYYERDGITIYHADCRDVLSKDMKVDLVLTDPPYGIDGGRGGNARRGKGKYKATMWDDTQEYLQETVLPVIEMCLKLSKRAIITPGLRNIHLYPAATDVGCMWTPAAIGRGPWGFCNFQPVLYYGKDPRAGLGSWPTGIQVIEGPSTKEHPCAKPMDAWQWFLAKGSSDADDIILDPFMGSGTTLRAAKNLGRKAIGIEIEEHYCELAVKQLAQEVLPL